MWICSVTCCRYVYTHRKWVTDSDYFSNSIIGVCFHLLANSCIGWLVWFSVFASKPLLPSPQEHDEPILKHLQDIKVKFSDPGQPMVSVLLILYMAKTSLTVRSSASCVHQSFTLEFQFEPNDFFTNTVLTKTYKMRSEPDENDPFSFDGPEIMSCTGWVSVILFFLFRFLFSKQLLMHIMKCCQRAYHFFSFTPQLSQADGVVLLSGQRGSLWTDIGLWKSYHRCTYQISEMSLNSVTSRSQFINQMYTKLVLTRRLWVSTGGHQYCSPTREAEDNWKSLLDNSYIQDVF